MGSGFALGLDSDLPPPKKAVIGCCFEGPADLFPTAMAQARWVEWNDGSGSTDEYTSRVFVSKRDGERVESRR